MVRVDLFNYHMVYDVDEFDKHYYLYGLPYYKELYVGRHIYPDGVKIYAITPEIYIDLITKKRISREDCQKYVESKIDPVLMKGESLDGFQYIGDKNDYMGSMPSAVMQAVVQEFFLSEADEDVIEVGSDG